MRKKIERNLEKNVAEIIIIAMFLLLMNSCYTVQEMTMSDSKKATQCAWFNQR
jgi:hypothetical protein